MKIAIIYRGNIRGFKYNECYKTHEKMYNDLKQNNIDFDIHLCTNNDEYDDNNVNKIINLKSKYILDKNSIKKDEDYKKAYSNINFTTQGWSDNFQHNIITYWYNNNYLFDKIKDTYDKYILLDIAHIIDEFDINLLYDNNNYASIFESFTGCNTRILIADYELYKMIMTQFKYILNNELKMVNPESFNQNFLTKHNIVKTNKLKIFRIRTDKTILAF